MENKTEQLKAIIENAGLDIYENYSGRNMYGRKCIGVTFSGSQAGAQDDLLDAAVELGLAAELAAALRDVRTDSLGLDTIMYFPSYN